MCLDFREISDLASHRISFAKCTVHHCVGTGGVVLQKRVERGKIKDSKLECASTVSGRAPQVLELDLHLTLMDHQTEKGRRSRNI